MDVIIAARLSQEGDRETGIDTQDERAEQWARGEGHDIIAVVADHKSGAADWMDRKNLRPWLTEPARLVRYQGIVAYTQDRLSRAKWRDEIAIRLWAEDNGKELFIIDSQLHWPPRNESEQIRWELDASRARREWEQASERYRRMQGHLRDGDYLVGRPPFGYQVVPKDRHKTLALDPVTAPYVEAMAGRVLAGQPLSAVAAWLDGELPSPQGGRWVPKSISQILRNPVLTGRRKDARGKTILRVEPILDRARWNEVQAQLDSRTSHHVGPADGNTAMLTGIAVCGKCGAPMYRIMSGRWRKDHTRAEYHYYRCYGPYERRSTCQNMIPLDELEGWLDDRMATLTNIERVEETLIRGADPQEALERIRDEAEALDPLDPADDARRAELREEAEKVKARGKPKDKLKRVFTGVSMAGHWASLDKQGKRAMLLEDGVRIHAAKVNGEIEAEIEAESDAYLCIS